MAEQEKSNNSKRRFYIILIVVLAIFNGLLLFTTLTTTNENTELEERIEEASALNAELDLEIRDLQSQLTEYEGQNAELDSLLKAAEKRMLDLKSEVDGLIASGQITASRLNNARAQIEILKLERENYAAKIDSLVNVNQKLNLDNENLTQSLDLEKGQNVKLSSENENLSGKVKLGSLLKTIDLVASGIKVTGSNKEVTTNRAKKADKIKVCFDVLENRIAEHGDKTILMRIVGPTGTSLAIESRGSGTFKNVQTGEEMQFSVKGTMEYLGDKKRVCMYWEQDTQYNSGTHSVELYQNGYLIGDGTFLLK